MDKSQKRLRPFFGFDRIFLVMLVVIVFYVMLMLPWNPGRDGAAKHAVTRSEVREMTSALNKYLAETKIEIPSDNAKIYAALRGMNPGKITYFVSRNRTNSMGEFIDIWNTPYWIRVFNHTNFVVRSAGPNRQFGDKDDVWYDSALNASWKKLK